MLRHSCTFVKAAIATFASVKDALKYVLSFATPVCLLYAMDCVDADAADVQTGTVLSLPVCCLMIRGRPLRLIRLTSSVKTPGR